MGVSLPAQAPIQKAEAAGEPASDAAVQPAEPAAPECGKGDKSNIFNAHLLRKVPIIGLIPFFHRSPSSLRAELTIFGAASISRKLDLARQVS